MRDIPIVENAHPIIIPKTEDLMLPGNVVITYACNDGYELKSNRNQSHCEYNMQPRMGAPAGASTQLVTAVWRKQNEIRCEKGICHSC